MLYAVGEVLQGAQRDGSGGTSCVPAIRLGQAGHHHQSVTLASLGAAFQHGLPVLDAATVEVGPYAAETENEHAVT